MGLVLDMSPRSLEEVIYFASYVVLDPGDTPLEKKQLLTEAEYRDKKAEYGDRFKAFLFFYFNFSRISAALTPSAISF